jgi:hypothetical protein
LLRAKGRKVDPPIFRGARMQIDKQFQATNLELMNPEEIDVAFVIHGFVVYCMSSKVQKLYWSNKLFQQLKQIKLYMVMLTKEIYIIYCETFFV